MKEHQMFRPSCCFDLIKKYKKDNIENQKTSLFMIHTQQWFLSSFTDFIMKNFQTRVSPIIAQSTPLSLS